MATPKELLQNAISQMQSAGDSVLLCPFKKIVNAQGYAFFTLLKDRAESISAAIELHAEWQLDNEAGFVKRVNCDIFTQKKITGDYCLLYQDVIIFIVNFAGYTEKMATFHYQGRAVEATNVPLIDNLDSASVYGYSCFELLVKLPEFNILPAYAVSDGDVFAEGLIVARIDDSRDLTLIRDTGDKLKQMRTDTVSLYAVNLTRAQFVQFLHKLFEYGRDNELFGLSGTYETCELTLPDDYLKLKGIRYLCKANVCYNIEMAFETARRTIDIVMFKMHETISTPKDCECNLQT